MREAGARAARAAPSGSRHRRQARACAIGSAGTHPLAHWEDQRITAAPRYRDLVDALRFVARQEMIFGLHVHVGLDDPDKAIHVANGMRVHVPILLALSANSPFWRGDDYRPRLDADADLPRSSRASASRPTTRTGPTTSAGSASWSTRA